MTTIQIEYAKHIEQKRHNAMTEQQAVQELAETERANRAKELETHRANLATETETHRSNAAKEDNTLLGIYNNMAISANQLAQQRSIAEAQLSETYRSNKAREDETQRHNKATELTGYITGIPSALAAGSNAIVSLANLFKKK